MIIYFDHPLNCSWIKKGDRVTPNKTNVVTCFLAGLHVLHCHYHDVYPTTSRENIRRLGIILASAGLLSAFLEGGDPLVAAGLALVLGNLEHNP